MEHKKRGKYKILSKKYKKILKKKTTKKE